MFTLKTNISKVKRKALKDAQAKYNKLEMEVNLPMQFDFGKHLAFEFSVEHVPDVWSEIEEIFDRAHPQVFAALAQQLQANMRSAAWGWHDGARDIVDTGELMNSQSVQVSGSSMTVSYDSDYFGITHYGGYIQPYGNPNAEKVFLPARPWITATIEGGGPVPAFDFYQAYMNAVGA